MFAISAQHPSIIQQSDLPAIVVPGVGASLDSFAVTIQSFLGLGSGKLSQVSSLSSAISFGYHFGTITTLSLRMRRGEDPNRPDALLDQVAIKLLDTAEPTLAAMVHNNIGDAKDRSGKIEEAIAEYLLAVRLDRRNAIPHYNLGNALRRQGELDDAIAEYRAAIAIDPKYAHAHNNLGLALSAQGKLDDATAEYRAAIAIDPKYADEHYNLGLALRSLARSSPTPLQKTQRLHDACVAFT